MIGIIMNDITYFTLIERIRKNYPTCNIYICRKETEESIHLLKEKNCKIIITLNKELLSKEKKYPDISFLTLDNFIEENDYLLDDIDILKNISTGNEQEIRKRLISLNIPKDKVIYINNPKYLFIKHLIKEYYNNPIKDNIDKLIDEIERLKTDLNQDRITNCLN